VTTANFLYWTHLNINFLMKLACIIMI
jgi:hypothetical protein